MKGKVDSHYLLKLLEKLKGACGFSKVSLLFLLFLTYLIPLGFCKVDLTVYSFSFLGFLGAWVLFDSWERKLKRDLEGVVRAKMRGLAIKTPEVEAKLRAKELEISKLQGALEENTRGYEHKIDLMHSSVAKSRDKAQELSYAMERQSEAVKRSNLRYEDLRREYGHLHNEYLTLQTEFNEKLKRNQSLLGEYQQTINEQRIVIEKKQREIAKLEAKVNDLMYEVRSLLKLEQAPPGPIPFEEGTLDEELQGLHPSSSSSDLSHVLAKYLKRAQELTGVDHLGYMSGHSPRFLDTTQGSYHLDLRRLFDSFRDESAAIVFVFSRLEGRFLFVNNQVKNILGWSPEKFIKDFHHLVIHGLEQWEEALQGAYLEKPTAVTLLVQSKEGEQVVMESLFAVLKQGPFAGHVVGLLAPKEG